MNEKTYIAAVDVSGESIHWDLQGKVTYGGYLDLEKLLACQHPRSGEHDEMLFIIIHQASELWMKLSFHEISAAMRHIRADDLDPAMKMLTRMSRIQENLIQSWSVLSTLTPADYEKFREALGTGSGFQSYQYRMLEYALGNKNDALMEVHRHDAGVYASLRKVLEAPSLYDEALLLLSRRGFKLPKSVTARDWTKPYEPGDAVQAAWLEVYRNTEKYWDLYYLAEKLVDLEDAFQQWRFRHLKTVERIIGFKRGTGGSSGAPYLRKALDLRFFPELWTLRTEI